MKSHALIVCLLVACGVDSPDAAETQVVSGAMTCNLKSDTNVYTIPNVSKPGYLQSYTDPTFGTRITRITGDPGSAISSGGTWGSDVHHEYSKVQAWNADQSLIFIESNREGGSGSVLLDGSTYQPVFSRGCPGGECRWHPTDPNLMVYAGGNQIGYWYPRTNATSVVATFSGYNSLLIGPWEGNLSLDGRMIVVSGTGPSGNVAFAYDLVSKIKYPDIPISAFGTTLDWASISPRGDYVVVQVDNDVTFVTDLSGNRVASFTQGHPSHYDMTIDQNGDEVAVGKAVGSPYSGKVIKVRLRDAAMTPLTTGGYARHSSTRDTAARSWGVSSMEPTTSYPPYNAEIDLYNVDGSVVYRLAHHHDQYTDYESEVIPTIAPDGMRVMYASNFGASTGRPMQVYVIDLRSVCSGSTGDTTAPSVPAGVTASAVSSSQINLSWNASTDNVGVAGYKVFRDGVSIASVASAAYSDTGLAPSSSHSYTVLAYDAAGNQSAQSVPVSATTLPAASATTFHLDFGTGSSGSGSSPVASGYTGVPLITFSPALGYGWQSTSGMDTRDRSSSTSALQRDFHKTWGSHFLVNVANGTYAVTVYLGDNDNDLTNMYVSAQGVDMLAALSTSFASRTINRSFTTQVSNGQLDLRFYTTNPSSTYYGYIAVNGIDIVPATSADTTAPSVPTGLAASAISSSQVNLGWLPSTDNVGVTGYRLFRNGVSIATVASTSYSDAGLAAATTYSYTVAAYDAAGNQSPQSGTVSATTPAATSSVSTHLDFGTGTSGSGTSPVASGYVGVPLLSYASSVGYGWSSTSGMDTRDRSSSTSALQRDFHKTYDGHFFVDVPNGNYNVSVYLGDNDNDLTNMYVAAQGVTVVQAAATSSTNRLLRYTFMTSVTNGRLDVRFYTTNSPSIYYGYIAVNGIDISSM